MPSQKKVLIIDDETDLCLLVKSHFLKKQFEVAISHTLQDGLSKLHKLQPDIVFLDNNLPDGSGWANVNTLANEYPGMHLILISAYHSSTPNILLNNHFQVIEKPISLTDLDKRLEEMQFNKQTE